MAAQPKRPKIIVMGRMCHDAVAGAVWHFLNYMLGFEQLGFETYYVEWTDNWVADPVDSSQDSDFPRVIISSVMKSYGFADRWICRADHLYPGATYGGMAVESLPRLYEGAVAIVNVSGTHVMNPEQMSCKRRVYLETDPGIPQIKLSAGDEQLEAQLDGHTHFFTFAENIGAEDCLLPDNRFRFHTTRQAVCLEQWQSGSVPVFGKLNTISKWAKKKKDIVLNGDVYGWSKSEQFERFLNLPLKSVIPLEIAFSGASEAELETFINKGWNIVDALSLSSSLSAYRDYIWGSAGEFTIAKDQYVRLRTGWFSDRSACYLAAGRPVITQDTGFGCALPTGRGLFGFHTLDDIIAAIDEIQTHPLRNREAARDIGAEYFDSRKNLSEMLEMIGLEVPTTQ